MTRRWYRAKAAILASGIGSGRVAAAIAAAVDDSASRSNNQPVRTRAVHRIRQLAFDFTSALPDFVVRAIGAVSDKELRRL